MPEQYLNIRNSMVARGLPMKEAKKRAARTYIKRGAGGTRSSRARALRSDRRYR